MFRFLFSVSFMVFLCTNMFAVPSEIALDAIINGGEDTLSTTIIDLDACLSTSATPGSNSDFSEFTAEINNISQCANMELVGGSLYRENPTFNGHSCTPGLNGSNAMCVSSLDGCEYQSDTEKSVRFDVFLSPMNGNSATIHELRFMEKAPTQYDWIDGPSGLNDYPQFYGIRITANDVVLYEAWDISTEQDWNLELFDFSDSLQFIVNSPTVFNFELVAYCQIGNNAQHSVWDLEDIQISSGCIPYEGGEIALDDGTDSIEFCTGDGEEDQITPSLADAIGPNQNWVITDNTSNILAVAVDPPFDFENAGGGTCLIWHVSYLDGLIGLEEGASLEDLDGCYSLSNQITVIRNQVTGGALTFIGGSIMETICVGQSSSEPIEVELTDAIGTSNTWLITTEDGEILDIPASFPVDFDNAGEGKCLIWNVAHDDVDFEFEIGTNIDTLEGCISFSNSILVERVSAEGGEIEFSDGAQANVICEIDGQSNMSDAVLTGESGQEFQWLITAVSGDILATSTTPFDDYTSILSDTFFITHLASAGIESLLTIGENINEISGCFSLSNSISLIRNSIHTGVLNTSDGLQNLIICADDGESDEFSINLEGEESDSSLWIVADGNGNIIDIPTGPNFDFDGSSEGVCFLYSLAYNGMINGVEIGSNIGDFTGCHSLSNFISITKLVGDNCDLVICDAEGGQITLADGTNSITICADDGVDEMLEPILNGNIGQNSQWIITDTDANILAIPSSLPISVEGAEAGLCLIWHLSYEDGLTGLEVGNSLTDLDGCYGLSNTINVTRLTGEDCDELSCMVEGGQIALLDGSTEIAVCVGDAEIDSIDISLVGNTGTHSIWALVTVSGNILELDAELPVEIADLNPGVCLIYHISYEEPLIGLEIDSNIINLDGCYSLSNAIVVTKLTGPACDNIDCFANGGTISSTDGLTEIELCVNDSISDAFDVVLNNAEGDSSIWIISDVSGNILALLDGGPFDLEGAGAGICIIWHLSYEADIMGLEIGENLLNLDGCHDLSNTITVTRYEGANCQQIGCEAEGGIISFTDGSTQLIACSGDGIDDLANVNVTGNEGTNDQWIITDNTGIILDLPTSMPYNFEGAGAGICQIFYLSYEDGLEGLEVGNHLGSIAGCFGLSNGLLVIRNGIEGGELTWPGDSLSLEICVGDGLSDSTGIVLIDAIGDSLQWIITDDMGTIIGLPDSFPIDFESVEAGTCYIYNLSYNDTITGVDLGADIENITGDCYELSNSIQLVRLTGGDCDGGIIYEKPILFSVGPNPTSGIFYVKFENFERRRGMIRLMDQNGRSLATKFSSGEDVIFDTEGLFPGIYHVVVWAGGKYDVKKVVKIK